jgi:hypothetical protein
MKPEKDMSPSELLRWRELEGSGELAQSRRFRDASCGTCVFWDKHKPHVPTRGSCRKRVPDFCGWPITAQQDWCGSWERDYDQE